VLSWDRVSEVGLSWATNGGSWAAHGEEKSGAGWAESAGSKEIGTKPFLFIENPS
jgi:hypothetical protein